MPNLLSTQLSNPGAASWLFEFPRSTQKTCGREGGCQIMIVFLTCKFSLPASSIGCLGLGFCSWIRGSCMLSPGLCPRYLWLPCSPQNPEICEMPTKAHLGFGILGKLPNSRFVVTEGRLRGTDQVPRGCRQLRPGPEDPPHHSYVP